MTSERLQRLARLHSAYDLRSKAIWAQIHGLLRVVRARGGYCSTMLGASSGAPLVYETRWAVGPVATTAGEPGDPEHEPALALELRGMLERLAHAGWRKRKIAELILSEAAR